MPVAAGTRLGPYEILGPVGAGGMAEVYRARDPRLGRDVALKILPADHASDPARVRRFQHEAHAVAALNHPNILALYDTGTEDGVTYAVFELLEGQTLRGLLQKGPVARAKVVDYGVQVCRGLAAAHEKGIVHRDLKPENLFLTRDGVVKILDFGLARLVQPREDEQTGTLSQGTDAGVVMGTVGYMSPEQVRGEPADHRSDLFSLGAVLYEMLSGQRAFRGTSSVETLNAILKEEPAEIVTERKIPPALERLVRHCLEKSPDDRFQSARDLAFELGGLSTPSGIGAPPLVPAGAGRLRRWLALGLATVVIGSSLFGGGVLLGRRRTPSPIPSYKQITFRRGIAASGRFTPDGKTVVYAASWDDAPAPRIYSVRIDAPESQPLDLPPGQVVGVSSKGEVAILMPKGAVSEMVVYPELPGTLARVPLSGGTPRPVAENVVCADWAPDGDRLAALRAVDGALQIEFPLGTVLARETPEDRLFACPRFSPRGDRLAFGTGNGYRVVEIGSGRAFSIGVPEWGHGTWWSWSPDGREIWFTAGLGNSWPLEAVTLDGRRRLLARIPGTTVLYDVSRDGRLLLQHNFARTRSFARAPGEVTEREVSVFDSTLVADISADGTLALLTERGAAAGPGEFIYLRRTDGSPPMRLAEQGRATALSPDGRWVLVYPAAWTFETPRWRGVRVVPTGAGEARQVPTPGLVNPFGFCFPTSRQVLVVARENESDPAAQVFVVDLDGGGRRAVTPPGIHGPFACDDSRVACLGPSGRLTVYPLDGSHAREVPWVGPALYPMRFTPDGAALLVVVRRTTRTSPIRVERVDLATGRRTLVREIRPPDWTGVWLPAGGARVTPDGEGYVYFYYQWLHDLHVADGLW